MAYLVVAYPELTINDFDKIQKYRELNDKLFFNVVKPHFTIVFPVFDITESEFIDEIKLQANSIEKITFNIKCSTINKDAFSDYYHSFLVPDEGFSRIIRLHDKLYSDKLKDNLRLDIDFVPHIGIGNSLDKHLCKAMVDEWNKNDFSIAGTISELTIVKYENGIVENIEKIRLR
ncbi:2'-5' RNA ligase family protein [Flavobacterium aestuarii]|uniref:2'-5' RNA ligase family protein n=1 Tax=Flavobacterium aestuarii TaxID=3149227 RepID=UPI0032B51CBF